MTQKSKTILTIASGAVLVSLVGVMLAYFIANDNEPNLVGVGEDKITVTEAFTQPAQEQEFKYRKLVKIKNTGSIPCYIRVRLEFSNSDVQNVASFSSENQRENDNPPPDSSFKSAQIAEGEDDYINNLPDGWVYIWEKNTVTPAVTNGYYYYTKVVKAGDATNALISWVKMNYLDEDDIQAHDVYVYAESVQTIDPNSGTAYTDWKAAWNGFAG